MSEPAFDPKKYLAEKMETGPSLGEFDPAKYLAEKTGAKPESLSAEKNWFGPGGQVPQFLKDNPTIEGLTRSALELMPTAGAVVGGGVAGTAGAAEGLATGGIASPALAFGQGLLGAGAGAAAGKGVENIGKHYLFGEEKEPKKQIEEGFSAAKEGAEAQAIGGLLGKGISAAAETPLVQRGLSTLGKGAAWLGEGLTGIPNKVIETYAKKADEIGEMAKASDKDVGEAADQIRKDFMDSIDNARKSLNDKISAALGRTEPESKIIGQPALPGLLEDLQRTAPKDLSLELNGAPASIARVKPGGPLMTQSYLPDLPTGETEAVRLFGKPGEANFGESGGETAKRLGKKLVSSLEGPGQREFLEQNAKEQIGLLGKQGEFEGLDLVPRTSANAQVPGVGGRPGQTSFIIPSSPHEGLNAQTFEHFSPELTKAGVRVPGSKIIDALQSAKGQIDSDHYPEQIAKVDELISSVSKKLASDGTMSVLDAHNVKRFLQEKATQAYRNPGDIFSVGTEGAKAAKAGGAIARELVNKASPEVASANNALSQLHDIEDMMNSNLIAEGKPHAGLLAAGSGTNPRNANYLKDLGALTGKDMLGEAEKLAAMRSFGSPDLLPVDPTGKSYTRLALGGALGALFGGTPISMAAGAALTSPATMKVMINAGLVAQKLGGGLALTPAGQQVLGRSKGLLTPLFDREDKNKPSNSQRVTP